MPVSKEENEDACWTYLQHRLRDLDHYTDGMRKCIRERKLCVSRVLYTNHNELRGLIDAAENTLHSMKLAADQLDKEDLT